MTNTVLNVDRTDNTLTLKHCDHPKCVSDFLKQLKNTLRRGYQEIIIKSNAEAVFPNACVPIAGIIDYYTQAGISFEFDIDSASYLSKCGFISPYARTREEIQKEQFPFDKIFCYEDSGQVANITQAYIDAISHQSLCETGVLNGLTWCINEVMDNVLVHSQSSRGMVMAQYHPAKKHIVFCIYDSGVGIYNTMKSSTHQPTSEIDALSLAIQEGIGDGKGQGNGLYGLFQIVRENKGSLTITSGASSLMLPQSGELQKFGYIPFIDYEHRATTVDFQLDLSRSIDIKKVLSSIGSYDGFDIRIDNMLNDSDFLVYDVFNNGKGTATREAGEYIRVDIENILRRNEYGVILDFSNTKTVSSSFIDELVSKLFVDLGFIVFNNAIRLANMSPEISFLCERSLYMRIYELWKNNNTA
mgnify:CR=1 FL=1